MSSCAGSIEQLERANNMRFYVRKRRQAPAVIIVALIDILIVLLIFLMVTTTFKQQPALNLTLPESTHAQKAGADENAPFIVSLETNGTMRVGPDNRPATFELLKQTLVAAVATNAELKVAVRADKLATVGQFLKVFDTA